MGLIADIIATPQDQDVCIRLDNQAVVKLFNDIVINQRRASVRDKLRGDLRCGMGNRSTTVEWVKGHSSDRWNAEADKAAKEAHSAVGKAWEVNAEDQDDLRYTATMAGTIDTRQALKMQTTRRWHQAWRSLKRHKRSIQDYDGTDWLGILAIIHSNKPCHATTEDNEHIWLRPEGKEAHDEIWKDGLGRIDFWGAVATRHYNREKMKRRKEGETRPKEIV
ncbi:MAG: hypothetical protein JOS17DRAFT_830523 [Linnemannia elongata]|nr:MAG: hypothetical protein JOS17DRAFT_830523 [Linnemannia elongata]